VNPPVRLRRQKAGQNFGRFDRPKTFHRTTVVLIKPDNLTN
jgi:hypothetical protein